MGKMGNFCLNTGQKNIYRLVFTTVALVELRHDKIVRLRMKDFLWLIPDTVVFILRYYRPIIYSHMELSKDENDAMKIH